MTDKELKLALESIRHKAIRAHLHIDEISLWSLLISRSKLKKIDSDLTKLAFDLLKLEDIFDENIEVPDNYNSAVMRSAQLSILFAIRSTTHEAVNSAKLSISQIYNNLNFYRSLVIALIALIVSIVGLAQASS